MSYVKYIIKLNFTYLDLHFLKANRTFPMASMWHFCFHGAVLLWLSIPARILHPRSEGALLSSVVLLHGTCFPPSLTAACSVQCVMLLLSPEGAAAGLVGVSAPSHEGDQPHAPWVPCRGKCPALLPLDLSWRELCQVSGVPLSWLAPPLLHLPLRNSPSDALDKHPFFLRHLASTSC